MMTPLHKAAREWAEAGFSVFPCHAGRKEPASEHGIKDATTALAKIDEWWTANGNYNIGVAPDASGCLVVDLDPPLGLENWKLLCAENGEPPQTLTIRTPRGGLHLWFDGTGRTSASTLAAKIDTRGRGGYVLVPPSAVAGNPYTYDLNVEMAPLPSWVTAKLETSHVKQEETRGQLDQSGNIGRARQLLQGYVARGDVAIEGQGGDDRTYRLCCEVLNLGLSVGRALALILEIWNPACSPPWSEEELEAKVNNAASYCQNAEGCWANPSGDELFGDFAAAQPETSGTTEAHAAVGKSRFHFRSQTEQENAPEPRWLIPNVLPEEGLVLMYGKPESFKSFLALDIVLSLSAAVPILGFTPAAAVETAYIAGEGARSIERKRAPAWRIGHDVQGDVPMFTIDEVPWASMPEQVNDFIATAKKEGRSPRVVVIDTASYFMTGLNENDARDTALALQAANHIRRSLKCTVILVHHAGKDKERGARGSSNFMAWCDTVLEVTAENRVKAVSMRIVKQKDAEKLEQPFNFVGRQIGPSLVFFPATTDEYRDLMDSADATAPRQVGAALHRLQAYGDDAAVTTAAVAAEIASHAEGTDPMLIERLLSKNSKAGKPLEAYRLPSGLWALPEEARP